MSNMTVFLLSLKIICLVLLVVSFFVFRADRRPSLTANQRILVGAARIRAAREANEVSE